jgi:hypothetical protein
MKQEMDRRVRIFKGFKVNDSTKNILKLTVTQISGGFLPDVDFTINFDLRNGNPILLENLFSPEGLEFLISESRKRLLKKNNERDNFSEKAITYSLKKYAVFS